MCTRKTIKFLVCFSFLQNTKPPSGFQVLATKTYFTTSTYYTTLIDQGDTITRTRTKVKSSVVTETYDGEGASFTTNPSPQQPIPVSSTLLNYISLGPNIYGKVKTLFQTYTYFTTDIQGFVDQSKEIITQVSTSLFSTTKLPDSITINEDVPTGPSVQLSPSRLSEIKQSYLASQTAAPELNPSQEGYPEGIIGTKPGSGVLWDKPYLSSLKESFQSSLDADSQPVDDIDLPQTGAAIITPPGQDGDQISPARPVGNSEQLQPGFTSLAGLAPQGQAPDLPSVADIDPSRPENQQLVANVPVVGDLVEAATGSESQDPSDDESTTATSSQSEGGIVNAVVGGIADGLGVFGDDSPVSGLQVDLGPVLDAVATLLRGPIRSAIANRRSEAQERSDGPDFTNPFLRPTQPAILPSVSMLPAKEPNFIPVGGFGRSPNPRAAAQSRENVNLIPIQRQSRPNNAPVALRREAQPRIDIEGDVNAPVNFVRNEAGNIELPEELQKIIKNQYGQNPPLVVEKDKIIINDHVINSNDPTIIDVLNKQEQGFLFGKHNGRPMAIQIVAGLPMTLPKQVRVPGGEVNPDDIVYVPPLEEERPTFNNVRVPPKDKRPRRPPPPPGVRARPIGKPPKRPPPPPPPRRPPPVRKQPPKQRPKKPIGNLADDSANQFSVNSEVVVKAPPNFVGGNKRPPPNQPISLGKRPVRPNRPLPPVAPKRPNYPKPGNKRPPPPPKRPQVPNVNRPPPPKRPARPPPFNTRPQQGPRPGSRPPPGPRQPQPGPRNPPVSRPGSRPPPPGARPPPRQPNYPRNPQPIQPQVRPLGEPPVPAPPAPNNPFISPVPTQGTDQRYQVTPSAIESKFTSPPGGYQLVHINQQDPASERPPQQPTTAFVNVRPQATGQPPVIQPVTTPATTVRRPTTTATIEKVRPSIPFLGGNGILPRPSRPGQNDRKDNRPTTSAPVRRPQVTKAPPTTPTRTPNTPPQTPNRPPYRRPQRPTPPLTPRRTTPRPTQPRQRQTKKPYTPIDEPSLNPQFGNRLPDSDSGRNAERRPYNDNNPNKARRPRPTQPLPGVKFGVEVDGEIRDVTLTDPFGKPRVIQTKAEPQIEPSYTTLNQASAEPDYPRRRTDLVRISTGSSDPIDYEGWRTDTALDPSVIRPTSSYFDVTLPEREGAKTTTYAKEWSAYDGDRSKTRIRFTPQKRPQVNTNFQREWTVRDDQVIRPTKTSVISRTLRPYQTRYNDNWRVTVDESVDIPDIGEGNYGEKLDNFLDRENPNRERRPISSTIAEEEVTEEAIEPTTATRPEFTTPNRPVRPPRPSRPARPSRPQNRPSRPQGLIPTEETDKPEDPTVSPDFEDNNGVIRGPLGRPINSRPGFGVFDRPIAVDLPTSQPTSGDIVVGRPQTGSRPPQPPTIGSRPPFNPNRPPFSPNRPPFNPNRPPLRPRPTPTQPSETNDGIIGIPDVEPSTGDDRDRPQRRPFVRPFRPEPFPNAGERDDDFIKVIEGTFENQVPILPVKTDDLPFTTNIVVRQSLAKNTISTTSTTERSDSTKTSTEPDTFVNTRPTRIRLPTQGIVRPTIRPPVLDVPTPGNTESRPTFPPRTRQQDPESPGESSTPRPKIKVGGIFPFGRTTRRPFKPSADGSGNVADSLLSDGERRREEVVGDALDGAIVESVPGSILSAEDSDPQTRCQSTCGVNENCQINANGGIDCKCRPGFGRKAPNLQCESKMHILTFLWLCTNFFFVNPESRTYQIEVVTKSSNEREEITFIRLSPKAVQRAVEETFKNNINVSISAFFPFL